MEGYAELQVTSNFSFLRGASHPSQLVEQAAKLGHAAIAITDRNTLAGVVRAHTAAQDLGLRFVVGCRLDLLEGRSLLCYPTDKAAYSRLTRLLTLGKRKAPKGECHLTFQDVAAYGEGQILVALPSDDWNEDFQSFLSQLVQAFPQHAYLAAQHLYRGDDAKRLHRLAKLAAETGLPLVATNDVLYHKAWRRVLQDVVTCIREGCTIAEAGLRLEANGERHLKPAAEMTRLFRNYKEAVERSLEIVERCTFNLKELKYEYPYEAGVGGRTPQEELVRLTWEGAKKRYPDGVPEKVRTQVERELKLIANLKYASYFLTVHDIMRFARSQEILCQGRGSAANSSVCYCLEITAVDPSKQDLLFERFVSEERGEPPDIDVDFEHERREEVIQYIYGKYGRDRTGLAATVIHYRSRRAIREVSKVMGLSTDVAALLSGTIWGWSNKAIDAERVRSLGLDPEDRTLMLSLKLIEKLIGFPRHLSQHVGGFVITQGKLDELVPIENAAMENRTIVEWDKDDLEELKILKVDVLALGMLSCVRRAFALIDRHYERKLTIESVMETEEPGVYDMVSKADTIGVFQVESRAQMSMLPRLKPREFYDLVIEVAIVRPGPIQGNMVHPYLRRREGKESMDFPSPALFEVLKRTCGVPLFQEQAMQIAIVAAGFTPAEADRLRRAMASFRHIGTIKEFEEKFLKGMAANGYKPDFARRCFDQIKGFSDYGFPESHAASFAILVYVSAWIKWRHPDVFACALLNSQPMGFYQPAQLARDAIEHGVEVRPVDVNESQWDCTLEPLGGRRHALRLGFRETKGLRQVEMERLVAQRGSGYSSARDLQRRAALDHRALEMLARADAFRSLGLDRRQALWTVKGLGKEADLPLFAKSGERPTAPSIIAPLPQMGLGEHILEDYSTIGLSLKRHPVALLRESLARDGRISADKLVGMRDGQRVDVAGIVLVRQRPGTAKVVFITLEDETGVANLVIWPQVFERYRRAVMGARLLGCGGRLQREGLVTHVVAYRLEDLTPRLRLLRHPDAADNSATALATKSRDFH